MTPRLLRSALTGRVYIVTKYRDLGDGKFNAITKYDCTDEFNALAVVAAPVESECATCGHVMHAEMRVNGDVVKRDTYCSDCNDEHEFKSVQG